MEAMMTELLGPEKAALIAVKADKATLAAEKKAKEEADALFAEEEADRKAMEQMGMPSDDIGGKVSRIDTPEPLGNSD